MQRNGGSFAKVGAVIAAIFIGSITAVLVWFGLRLLVIITRGSAGSEVMLDWACAVPAVAVAIALGRKIIHLDPDGGYGGDDHEIMARTGPLVHWLHAFLFLGFALAFWGGSFALIVAAFFGREHGPGETLGLVVLGVLGAAPLILLGSLCARVALDRIRWARNRNPW